MAQTTARYLALETSSPRLSLALGDTQNLTAVYRGPLEWRHAETLFTALERIFRKAGWRPRDLTGVAVSVGPGSFTGIRIGLAVARTLGQSLEIPVVGVSSLETMAAAVVSKTPHAFICPEIDALSGKIFTALFERSAKGELSRRLPEVHSTPEEWKKRLGALRLAALPRRITEPPDAAVLLRIARPLFQKQRGGQSYRKVLPLYLRQPAAQERRKNAR